MTKLFIVESPSKAKTIQRYLGRGYKVIATVGHILDLPKNRLGIDIENKYEPEYIILKNNIVSLIKSAEKDCDEILLAQDPDREGESIAWQVVHVTETKKPYKRVVYHEITKNAILEAIENGRDIDENLVNAQKARRILDRLVGYPLSQLIWKKIRHGLSAGRVQSPALRLIVEREREIIAFVPEKYFIEYLNFKRYKGADFSLNDQKGRRFRRSEDEVNADREVFSKVGSWVISDVKKNELKRNPPPPFTTSTLQQVANNVLGYSSKMTMSLAQQLYQGVEIKGAGQVSLITYIRTDSVNLSDYAVKNIRDTIRNVYGDKYLENYIRGYKNKSKLAQEAHEAIRPTNFEFSPEKVKDSLSPQLFKLYKLVWNRTVATQMRAEELVEKEYVATPKDDRAEKRLTGMKGQFLYKTEETLFEGYEILYGKKSALENKVFEKGEELILGKFNVEAEETKPPARYTDATLIGKLEKLGIGRPSTYASIISTLLLREYIVKEARYLKPTDSGILVNDFLCKHFKNIVDFKFTSDMEADLDGIAQGKKQYDKIINSFYSDFDRLIKLKDETVRKEDVVVIGKSDEKCPICGGEMEVKIGRKGKFISCKKFPECKGIISILEIDQDKYEIPAEVKNGEFVLKNGRFGMFWAHKDYPAIKLTKPLLLKERCPECGANLVEKKSKKGRSFTGCSAYPKCKYIKTDGKKYQGKREGSTERDRKS